MDRRIATHVTDEAPCHRNGARASWHLPPIIGACLLLMIWVAADVARAGVGYVGVGGGSASATVDKGSVAFHTEDWKPSISDWRLFAGYRAGKNVGIEGGYVALGKARVSTNWGQGDSFEARLSGFEFTPTGHLPIVGGLSALARVGIIVWHSDVSYHYSPPLGSGKRGKSGSSLALSAGAEYAIGRHVLLRAEFSMYDIDKAKAGAGDVRAGVFSAGFAF